MERFELTEYGQATLLKWRKNNPDRNFVGFDCLSKIKTVQDAAGYFLEREHLSALHFINCAINIGTSSFWGHINAVELQAEMKKCLIRVPYDYGQNRCCRCGNYAEVITGRNFLDWEIFSVRCTNIDCANEISRYHISRINAIFEWNKKNAKE